MLPTGTLSVWLAKFVMRRILGLGRGLLCLFVAACSGGLSESDASGGNGGTRTGGSSGAAGKNGTPATCTSQTYWTGGDKGSEVMHPGRACMTCHSNSPQAPTFSLAGTIYPTSHEPDDCNGRSASSGITIVVTDAAGKQLPPIPVNDVGNFRYDGRIASPFHVKVVFNGKENAMSAAPDSGECNACHTQNGANSAPGRILAP
jgi:hypothetical protein